MRKKYILTVILAFVFLIIFLGARELLPKRKVFESSGKISVITSFYPLYYFSSEIGGDKVEVENITPAGTEPHDYEPTARDIAKIQRSKLLVLIGNGFEAWGEKQKTELVNSGVMLLELGQGLITEKDPHVWLDPLLSKSMSQKIAMSLMNIDPENREYYLSNLEGLNKKFDELDGLFRESLGVCKSRDLVTSHAAFGYLAKAYELKQVSISGISPDEEPSTKDLAEISKYAKNNGVKYIFVETLINPRLAETLATEVGAQTLVLDPLEGLSEEKRQSGENYFTIMEDNLENLKTALECQ